MLFNVALFSSLLLAPVVLAVPSGLSPDPIARRGKTYQSQLSSRLEMTARDDVYSVTDSNNWAGAVWTEDNDTFNSVTGTFTVPTPSGSDGSASIWVGIDGDTCRSALLQTGITVTIESGTPTYSAWYEWYPDYATTRSDITISAGDVIKLIVLASSANSGIAMIENLSNGQFVAETISSSAPLCRQNAEWIVEDYSDNHTPVPFVDFGTVTFTNAVAIGYSGVTYSVSGANTTYDIQQNHQVLTNVSTDGDSVTIQYV